MISLDDNLSQNSSHSDSDHQTQFNFAFPENEKRSKDHFFQKLKPGQILSLKPLGSEADSLQSYLIKMSTQVTYYSICYKEGYSDISDKIQKPITSLLEPHSISKNQHTKYGSRTYEIYQLDKETTPVVSLTTSESYFLIAQMKEILKELNELNLSPQFLSPCLFLRRGTRLLYCGRGCIQEQKNELKGSLLLRMQSQREQHQLSEVAKLLRKWLNGRGSERMNMMIKMALERKIKSKHFFRSVNAEIESQTQDLWKYRLQRGVPDSFLLPTLMALQQFNIELSTPLSVDQKSQTLILVSERDKSSIRQIILALVTGMLAQAIISNTFMELSKKFYYQLKCLKHNAKQIEENSILAFLKNIQRVVQSEKNTEKAIKSCLMRLSVDSLFTDAVIEVFELYTALPASSFHSKLYDLQTFVLDAFGYSFDIEKYTTQDEIKSEKQSPTNLRIVKIKQDQNKFGVILPSYWTFSCSEVIYFFEIEGQETPCDISSFMESWEETTFRLTSQDTTLPLEDRKSSEPDPMKNSKKLSNQPPKVTVRQSSARWAEMFKSQEMEKNIAQSGIRKSGIEKKHSDKLKLSSGRLTELLKIQEKKNMDIQKSEYFTSKKEAKSRIVNVYQSLKPKRSLRD